MTGIELISRIKGTGNHSDSICVLFLDEGTGRCDWFQREIRFILAIFI